MHSKRTSGALSPIGKYCDGILEAGWLAAITLTPVFYNIYSSRIFEPDKAALLRTLALVMLAAWLVKLLDQGAIKTASRWKDWLKVPLLAPVVAYTVVYLLATALSVSPRISFWGSYQRLQGMYTMLAYLTVFGALVANLRRRQQLERLVGAVILASLPVSMYGVLQRFKIDPVPWGGDVSQRIAANMGNSIFVGAYFILAFPLTFLRLIEAFEALLQGRGQTGPNFLRATAYVFIVALQVIALYFTGSRGPWLGWGASLVFIWLGLALIWRKRQLTLVGVGLALAAGVFLILLNLPQGPLAGLRTNPALGRLGQLLDAESRTGRVRSLIWQGAVELVKPHAPLEYPDGRPDALNFLRPLIGYGPESMYVAYNRFYPPELTQVEKRNATPDRSHNETWDALVTTGLLGLITYLVLFGSVLYYGLKWLNLITSHRQRNLFLGLYLVGGLLSAVIFVAWQGWGFLGVALPFGMILGVIIYLIGAALGGRYEALPTTPAEKLRAYLLLGLLAAIVAHFVEINFGIAIVATRTYFWAYTALLLLVGLSDGDFQKIGSGLLAGQAVPSPAENSPSADAPGGTTRSGKARRQSVGSRGRGAAAAQMTGGLPEWLRDGLALAFILTVVLVSVGYGVITNSNRLDSSWGVLWSALTTIEKGRTASAGVLLLMLTTWLAGSVVLSAQAAAMDPVAGHEASHSQREWLRLLGTVLTVSLLLTLFFLLWHAHNLAALVRSAASTVEGVMAQVEQSESILTAFYGFLFALILAAAYCLMPTGGSAAGQGGRWAILAGSLALAIALGLATNLRVIQADIAFKSADLFARGDTWPLAIRIYNRANDLAPNEDYYYLFLGRAYLEYARTLPAGTEREKLIEQAAADLRSAQALNPLNTDHTANLARLYSLWAAYAQDSVTREQRALLSEDYFSRAVSLSPNNARLWDEWAALYLNVMEAPAKALPLLQRAAEIDPYYDWTFGLLGDYYARYEAAKPNLSEGERAAALQTAIEYYQTSVELGMRSNSALAYNYAVAMGGLYVQLNQPQAAVQAYEQALGFLETISAGMGEPWRVELVLARLYVQLGDTGMAQQYATRALQGAPDDQKAGVQAVLTQLNLQP